MLAGKAKCRHTHTHTWPSISSNLQADWQIRNPRWRLLAGEPIKKATFLHFGPPSQPLRPSPRASSVPYRCHAALLMQLMYKYTVRLIVWTFCKRSFVRVSLCILRVSLCTLSASLCILRVFLRILNVSLCILTVLYWAFHQQTLNHQQYRKDLGQKYYLFYLFLGLE